MQHVLKREPCHKCQLPVFLAERLLHGSRLYHRTCLRCARCQSQLTPGSFYETEQDGEFCCETCPDEDASSTSVKDQTDVPADEARSTFSNKLALFQVRSAGMGGDERSKGLLNKSLSDEEKSKSLKRLTALYAMHSADAELGMDSKSGGVRSSFLTTQLTDEMQNVHQVEESDEEEDEENDVDEESSEDDEPPSLPTVEPPLDHKTNNLEIVTDRKSVEKPPLPVKPSELYVSQNNQINMPLSAVSKQLDEPHEEPLNAQPEIVSEKSEEQSVLAPGNDLKDETTTPSTEIHNVGDRLSLVLERLKQFESNAESTTVDPKTTNQLKLNYTTTSSHHRSFDDPVVPVVETVALEILGPSQNSIVQETTEGHSMKDELDHLQELAMRQAVDEINEEVQQQEIDKVQHATVEEILPSEVVVPTPRKRLSKTNKVETIIKPTAMIRSTTDVEATKPIIEAPARVINAVKSEPAAQTPAPSCNPFEDDEEDDAPEPSRTNATHDSLKSSNRNSLNPFDSSDDEVELDKLESHHHKQPNVQPTKTIV